MIRPDLIEFTKDIQKIKIMICENNNEDTFYPLRARFIVSLFAATG